MKIYSHKLIFISTVFVITLLTFLTPCQKLMAQDVGLGAKTSLNFSTQLNNFQFTSGDLQLDLNPTIIAGYNLSLIYRNRFTPNVRFQLEPSLIRLGAAYNESFTLSGFEFETDSETKLTYFQLPIMFELTTTPPDLKEFPIPWEETTYHISMGLYGSYLLDALFTGTNSGNPIGVEFEEEFENDVTNQFNEFDAGLIIGAGLEHGNQNKIGVETRLMLGFLNADANMKTEIKPNNLAISFGLYYML